MATSNSNEKDQPISGTSNYNTSIPSSSKQQQYNSQTSNVAGTSSSGTKNAAATSDSGSIFVGIDQFGMSKLDYQTIKAASDTLKVFFDNEMILFHKKNVLN